MTTNDTDDTHELEGYVETWWEAVGAFTALLADLVEEHPDAGAGTVWERPTDLPGWAVRDVVAHVAHLEAVLAGAPEQAVDVGSPAHVRSPMGVYTEMGVVLRREQPPAALLDEIRDATTRRHERLLADPPTDATATPEPTFTGVPWDWRTLLRNRPLDVWMHEQDLRRALDRPGGLDSRAADHTVGYLSDGFGFVVGKRAAPPAGATAVLAVAGSPVVAVEVGDDGRARRVAEEPADPTVRLSMPRETYVVLAGGRRPEAASDVVVDGDRELGDRILRGLATTP